MRTEPLPALTFSQPEALRSIGARVDDRLIALLDAELARWSALDIDLAEPIAELRAMVLSGGKRLRPAFVHWGYAAAGGDPLDAAVADAGAAFEMLHTFALVHDDIVDDSSTRRGRRTAHVTFGERHSIERHRGEERRFGEGVAVLIGDLAHVYADLLTADFPRPALVLWNELRIELNVGQYLDLVGTARGDRDLGGAERIARYKSAKYTIERPLHLGAALAGRLDELALALSGYGIPLGEAFQLRDDILGVFGDPAVTGKPVGDDLREGKPTPLLSITVSRASREQRRVLERVGRVDLTPVEIEACQAIMVDTGALAATEQRIDDARDQALEALAAAAIDTSVEAALRTMATYVTTRDR